MVLNKTDLLSEQECDERASAVIEALAWDGPVYRIAAIKRMGTEPLAGDLMTAIESLSALEEDSEYAERELQAQTQMQAEARERIESLRRTRADQKRAAKPIEDEDDDFDVEVEYRP